MGEVVLHSEGQARGEEGVSEAPRDQDRPIEARKALRGLERVPVGDTPKKSCQVSPNRGILNQGLQVTVERSIVNFAYRNHLAERPFGETPPERPREKVHVARPEDSRPKSNRPQES